MTVTHPFALYSESGEAGVKSAEMAALFAPDVILHSPFLIKNVSGKQMVIHFLAEAFRLVGYPKYAMQLTDGQRITALMWRGNVQGNEIQGTMVVYEGEDGLIHELRSYLRPFQVVALLRDAILPAAAASLPKEEYWDSAPLGFPEAGAGAATAAALAAPAAEVDLLSPFSVRAFQGKRMQFVSSRPYAEVLQNLRELVETKNFLKAAEKGNTVVPKDFEKLVQKEVTPANFEQVFKSQLGEHDFMLFFEFDQSIWLPAFGIHRKVMRWVMGNPFIAITMMRHDITASLFTPVELLLFQNDGDDGSTIIYNLPSSLIVLDEHPELLAAAQSLDQKLYHVVSRATGVEAN